MKKDKQTLELPGLQKPRGRPPTGKAVSNADRQRAHRDRLKAAGRCPCCGQALPVGTD